jgi:hypothetical protein
MITREKFGLLNSRNNVLTQNLVENNRHDEDFANKTKMHLQNNKKFESTPVFVPKRMQKHSNFINYSTNSREEISLNAATLSNGFLPRKKSSISPLNRFSYSFPVKVEVHKATDNGSAIKSSNSVNEKMTAIKSILKPKQTDSVSNGAFKTTVNMDNKNITRKGSVVHFDFQSIRDDSTRAQLNKTTVSIEAFYEKDS